jgi:hypothetical protein
MTVRRRIAWKSCRTLTAEELELFEISSDGRIRRAKVEGVQRCNLGHLITLPNVLEKPFSFLRYCRACNIALATHGEGGKGTAEFKEAADENYKRLMRGDLDANRPSSTRS